MASVYIETTIPSYYFETRTSPQVVTWRAATREWWDRYRYSYQLSTSHFVLDELAAAPPEKGRRAAELLKDLPIMEEPPGLRDVVEYYLEHRLMPIEAAGDAFHLAMASLHSIDFLLTWNCRHLANANKTHHVSVINRRLGLPVPAMLTPLTLLPENTT